VRQTHPKVKDVRQFKADSRLDPRHQVPAPAGVESNLSGHHFLSEDESSIAQFRVDGFTFNRLRPYPGGDVVLAEALRLWAIYVRIAAPVAVSRAALRYINHITFPKARMADLLDAAPTPPEGCTGNVIQGFLDRIQCYDPESDLTVIRTIASAASKPATDGVSVIIDIDAFRRADMGVGEPELRVVLDNLRGVKNRVFFGSITDRGVEFLNEPDDTVRAG
jgi:uncharacterized protein (TIGR04255 family)